MFLGEGHKGRLCNRFKKHAKGKRSSLIQSRCSSVNECEKVNLKNTGFCSPACGKTIQVYYGIEYAFYKNVYICGLYYKHITIVIDDANVVSK